MHGCISRNVCQELLLPAFLLTGSQSIFQESSQNYKARKSIWDSVLPTVKSIEVLPLTSRDPESDLLLKLLKPLIII